MKSSYNSHPPRGLALLLTLLLFLVVPAFGQSNHREVVEFKGNCRIDKSTGVVTAMYNVESRVYQGTPEQIALHFLEENRASFGIATVADLERISTIQSPAGNHVCYRQRFQGIPVYGSETVVSINNESRVSMVVNAHKPSIRVSTSASIDANTARKVVLDRLLLNDGDLLTAPVEEMVIFEDTTGAYHLSWRISILGGRPPKDWLALVDARSGEVISLKDVGYSAVNGEGRAFKPDPVTALQDPSLTDQNNSDYPALQGAYKTVALLELNNAVGGLYGLQGKYAFSEDYADPFINTVTSPSTTFNYNRSQNGFEEVNIYSFIDTERRYLGTLGITPQWFGNDAVHFDAHGYGVLHDAYYAPSVVKRILFGDGGIDSGEDQDVVLHEYGHALHDALNSYGISSAGIDVRKLSEGMSDYLSLSYRRTLSLYEKDKTGLWFHAENPGQQRRLYPAYYGTYPSYWYDDIHQAGTLWATALMDLQDRSDVGLGRDVTTKLVLTSISYLQNSSIVPDEIQAMFRADRDIGGYNGSHLGALGRVFYERGFFSAGPIDPNTGLPKHPSNIVSGNITASATWSVMKWVNGYTYIKAGVTVTIPDNVYLFIDNNQRIIVESGGTLRIQQGSRVVSYDNAAIEVQNGGLLDIGPAVTMLLGSGNQVTCYGRLNAVGNAGSRITFTSSSPSSKWSGISIGGSGANGSRLEYVDIDKVLTYGGSAVSISGATGVTVRYCNISNNVNYSTTAIYFANAGAPEVSYNTFNSNGACGVTFYNTNGNLFANAIKYNSASGVSLSYASPSFGKSGFPAYNGNNTIKGGTYGIAASSNSYPYVGSCYNSYYGYNDISENSSKRVTAASGSDVFAEKNWWGTSNPTANLFQADGSSAIEWGCYLTYDPTPLQKNAPSSSPNLLASTFGDTVGALLRAAVEHRVAGRYADAKGLLKEVVALAPRSKEAMQALFNLLYVYRETKESEIAEVCQLLWKEQGSDNPNVGLIVGEIFSLQERIQDAAALYNSIATKSAEPEFRKYGLLALFHLYFLNQDYQDRASGILSDLEANHRRDPLVMQARWMYQMKTNSIPAEPPSVGQPSGEEMVIMQNYPNPFNPATTISYQIPSTSHVTLKIFDVLGRDVATLVDEMQGPGYKSIDWNASRVASGVYFYTLRAGDFVQTRKLLVLR